MTTASAEDRAGREHSGDLVGGYSGGSGRDTDRKCTRQAPPTAPNQPGRGPCPGFIDASGLCDWCGLPERTKR